MFHRPTSITVPLALLYSDFVNDVMANVVKYALLELHHIYNTRPRITNTSGLDHLRSSAWRFFISPAQYIVESRGWPQSRRKNSLRFPGFSRAINLLFHRLSQQKVNVIMTFSKGHDDHVYPVNSCFTQIFEWRTKNTMFVTIFHWGCTEFAEFSMFREIPEYSRFSRFVATLIH